jgi:hypothetical protein
MTERFFKAGGRQCARVVDGLVVAVFRHYESRVTESRPLFTRAIVAILARRPYEVERGAPHTHPYGC